MLHIAAAALLLGVLSFAQAEQPPEQAITEQFLRALYAGDTATVDTLTPYAGWFSDPAHDEARVSLDMLELRPITPADAGDTDPLSPLVYVQATTRFHLGDRTGAANYVVGLLPMSDSYRVSAFSRLWQWRAP